MANQPNSKLKLLFLLQILQKKTDEERSLSTQEIIEALAERGIDAARKSVYRDLEVLRDAGFDIEVRHEPYAGYALRTRTLDIEEMILLVDAVQSSPFLTEEMTDALIAKIGALASDGQRDMLARRVDVPGRVKMQNESVFENLNVIQHAMRLHRQISFQYYDYDERKRRVLRRDGHTYQHTPIRLLYTDGFYYLVTYAERHDDWVMYRVDRMIGVEVTDEPCARNEKAASYDPAMQESLQFGLFNEKPEKVTMRLKDPAFMKLVIDKFGPDVDSSVMWDGTVKVYARVVPSLSFFGWLLSMSDWLELESPKKLVRTYHERLEKALSGSEQPERPS